jgi:hypothetical protein
MVIVISWFNLRFPFGSVPTAISLVTKPEAQCRNSDGCYWSSNSYTNNRRCCSKVNVNEIGKVTNKLTHSLFDVAEVAVAVAPDVVVPPGYNVENLPAVIVDATPKQRLSAVAVIIYGPMTAEFPAES